MKGRPNNEDRITKTKDFIQGTTEKLGKISGRTFNHLAIEWWYWMVRYLNRMFLDGESSLVSVTTQRP